MSGKFGPRVVEKSSVKRWIRDGIELASRNAIVNTIAAVAIMSIYPVCKLLLPSTFKAWDGLLIFLCSPIAVGFFVLSAEAANRGRKFPMSQGVSRRIGKLLVAHGVILGGFLAGAVLLLLVMVMISGPGKPMPINRTETEHLWLAASGIRLVFELFIFAIFAFVAWFLPGLLCVENADIDKAFVLATEAYDLNPFIGAFAFFLWLCMSIVTAIFGILGIPACVVFGAIMYVSFIDIFYGEGIKPKIKAINSLSHRIELEADVGRACISLESDSNSAANR